MKEKYEHLKYLMERFDHYYDTINNKGAFYIGLNTFMLGGVIAGYFWLKTQIANDIPIWVFLILLTISTYISTAYTIKSMRPHTKDNYSNDDSSSLVFFGGIAKHTLNLFIDKMNSRTDPEVLEDMTRQVHCLAVGLEKKFKRLKVGNDFLLAQFYLLIPLIILILIKIN